MKFVVIRDREVAYIGLNKAVVREREPGRCNYEHYEIRPVLLELLHL